VSCAAAHRSSLIACAAVFESPSEAKGFIICEQEDCPRALLDVRHPLLEVVCGDVGFGKTEVAVRAIYLAACAGRRSALLVTSIVLAELHAHVLRLRREASSSVSRRTAAP
jgi:hypothetical protein